MSLLAVFALILFIGFACGKDDEDYQKIVVSMISKYFMLKTPLSIIHNQETLHFKKIKSSDEIEQATSVLNEAFKVWAHLGFKTQNADFTSQYLFPDGYIPF